MADFTKDCGPNAIDEYTNYHEDYFGGPCSHHTVKGNGTMTKCYASDTSNNNDIYQICSGITELSDNCFDRVSICEVNFPDTLIKIGSNCFRKSKIATISLPDSLEEIGHTNFPSTLQCIKIPPKIKDFPTDNLQDCPKISSIEVAEDNKFYRSIDGILYNYDVTEILLCPRSKTGKVIIPNTVRRIAERCFKDCKKLTMIELPRSIEIIEDYAFSGLNLDRLIIPNTVKSIGIGCFASTVIKKTFRFPHSITELPSYCFKEATIPSIEFLKNIEKIGDHCFEVSSLNSTLPERLILLKVKHISDYAFNNVSSMQVIELPASLSYIGEGAFNNTSDYLKIVCLSIAPIKLPHGAFNGISQHATLYVPKGSKIIYENALPWRSIINIEEFDIDKNFCDEEKGISDKDIYRLKNIILSTRNIDRLYLNEILQDITMSYQYVDNDEDYQIAMDLIKFNHRFNPVLFTDMDKIISANWDNKYKLRLLSTYLFDTFYSPNSLPIQDTKECIEQEEIHKLNLLVHHRNESSNSDQCFNEEIEVHYSEILRFLQNEISLTQRSIKIAVSWFTNYALFKQLKELARKGIDIQLIINNDSVNNGGYCLDFNELIELGVHISLVEFPHLLHHKFCIIDNKIVINGSYNWTRFSEKNFENIMIFRNNYNVTCSFNEEFENILQKAEYKDIKAMPESVPLKPEYDRNAFKQYITEELDEEARETSEQRDKITALHKAAKLNPEYFYKLNPSANKTLEEAFEVVEQSITITKEIIAMVNGASSPSEGGQPSVLTNQKNITGPLSTTTTASPNAIQQTVTKEDKVILEKIKASNLFMVLDVSGSMKSTYDAGHVYNITKKAVSAALGVSDTQEISLWEFSNTSSFVKNIGISNLSEITEVKCRNTGTNLNTFIANADISIKDNSLVIIFTDDDRDSINAAIAGMKKRTNVFWQIIVYGAHNCIDSAIEGISNISLICMTDYSSQKDSKITEALLKGYINWKNK